MGAPVWIDYNCSHCHMPNKATYATLPRINEDLIEKVNEIHHPDGTFTRVWRCRCTECGHSNLFNETPKGEVIPALLSQREEVKDG